MPEHTEKPKEEWESLQTRVIAAEAGVGKPMLIGWFEYAVIASAIGLILIGLYTFAIHKYWIYLIGSLLFGLGVAFMIMSQWMKSGAEIERKERRRLIEERDKISRCKYLDGELPSGKSSPDAHCRLYDKAIVKLPYCIYCKSYKS